MTTTENTSPTSDASEEAGPLFHFFSGKGGVGKTTLAAATAVHLASTGMRVLITSTDPAHSLSDVFDLEIGHEGIEIAPNLHALEVDSSRRWTEATVTLDEARIGRRGKIERVLTEAMRMMGEAPGVDEFMSLEILLETMSTTTFDAVIFDTAPTGHTLRLLVLPELLDGWIGRLLSIKSTFTRLGRAVRRFFPLQIPKEEEVDLGENLLTVRDQIKLARDLITDSERTLFALVTIPEAMSVLETQRTLEYLEQHNIPVGVVITNQVQPDSDDCDYCHLRSIIHQQEIDGLRDHLGDTPLRLVDSKPRIIRGVEALAGLGAELWS